MITQRPLRQRLTSLLITPQNPRRRLMSGLLIGAVVGLLLVGTQWLGLFSGIRTQLTDSLYIARPTTGITAIIAIDDASLAAYGRSTTDWSRTVHADLVRILDEAGARAIVFDVLFADPTDEDDVLAAAMADAGNVIQPLLGDTTNVFTTTRVGDFVSYDRYVLPTPALRSASRMIGHANILTDDDGQVRSVPLVINYNGELIPALGLAAYMQYLRIPTMNAVTVEKGHVKLANRDLYTDGIGQMLISFFGPPSKVYGTTQTYPTYSLVDVVEGRVDPAVFADKIVLIGALDAAGLPDNYGTPATSTGEKMYGVEIHANVIETIHQSLPTVPAIRDNINLSINLGFTHIQFYKGTAHLPLHPLSQRDQLAITFGLALLASLLLPFVRWYLGLILVVLSYGIFFVWAAVSFTIWGRITDLLYPAFALAFAFLGTMIVVYIFEERRRNQINTLFSRYVSTEIAQRIVEAFDAGQLELGGEEREITVLFADIRGFTALSEGLPPTEVVALLNVFLEEMNTIVLRYAGAINKYMGDNLMAFWNAPYPQDEHARLATQAGLAMLAAADRLNASGRFTVPVQFGIGVNTGRVVVGNIGSQQRLEYTPIGDAVNVAARLSSIAPGGTCYVGEATFAQIKDEMTALASHHVQVKGRREAVTVYELRPPGAGSAPREPLH